MDSYRENINGQRVYFNLPDVADRQPELRADILDRAQQDRRLQYRHNGERLVGLSRGSTSRQHPHSSTVLQSTLAPAGGRRTAEQRRQGQLRPERLQLHRCLRPTRLCFPTDRQHSIQDPLRPDGQRTCTTLGRGHLRRRGSSGPDYLRHQQRCQLVSPSSSKAATLPGSPPAAPPLGRAFVSLDDGRAETVDLYRTSTNRQQNVWSIDLRFRQENHTVKIWRDPKNSSGAYIAVDAVEVLGPVNSLLPAPETTPRSPTITALNSATGTTTGGTGVIITGTNLSEASALTFGDIAATRYTVNSSTEIMAIAPAHAAGPVRGAGHHAQWPQRRPYRGRLHVRGRPGHDPGRADLREPGYGRGPGCSARSPPTPGQA